MGAIRGYNMKDRCSGRLLLFCVAVSACAIVQRSSASTQPQSLQLQPCPVEALTGNSASARCGWIAAKENPDAAESREIRLRITVIPALRLKAQPDPLVILAGGPGQGAHDAYASIAPVFAGIQRDRDILLLDQRGTGQSNRLDCELGDPTQIESADPQRLQALAQQCLTALPGDPRLYTTSIAVRDLDAVRSALGYSQLNLYAVSYGTRVAQQYARRYPDHVRTMILDGVIPVDLALGPDVAPRAQQSLDAIFQRCKGDTACAAAFPGLSEQFRELRTRLDREPVHAHLADPVTAEMRDLSFGGQELNAAVRLLTYSDETASMLPLLIHGAQSANRPEPLIAQYLIVRRSLDTQFAYGMHFAVVCSEDAPHWAEQGIPDATADATYLGRAFMQGMKAVCDVWPRGVVDRDFHAPLQSDVPTLILSGGNDPVTPAAYGARALTSFRHGRHLVLKGQGHGQLMTGCMPRLATEFIDRAATSFDTRCLDAISPAPFMLSGTGAGP